MGVNPESHIGEEYGVYVITDLMPHKAKDCHRLYEATCKECGFKKVDRYTRIKNNSPDECTHVHEYKIAYCLQCGKEIPIGNMKPSEYNGRKFCNSNCAASYINMHRERDTEKKFCLNCGKEIVKQNKYCSQKCQHEHHQIEWETQWLNGEVSGNGNSIWYDISERVRKYLFKKYDNKCARCGWCEVNQYTGKIPLEVEHIDGNPYNTTPENVTLLCPNCHSLTRTYKGANKGHGRKKTWIPARFDKETSET